MNGSEIGELDLIDLTVPFHNTVRVEKSSRACEQGVVTIEPRSDGPPLHLHGDQDEWWEVIEGTLEVVVGGRPRVLTRGETMTIARHTPHTYANRGDAPCVFRYRLTPGSRFHEMLRTFEALVREGRLRGTSDVKSLFHLALVFSAFEDHVCAVKPPQAVMRALARVGRLFGTPLPDARSSIRRP